MLTARGAVRQAYASWWGLLLIETGLSGFLVWVLHKASNARSLAPIRISRRGEMAGLATIAVWMLVAGIVAYRTVALDCKTFNDLTLGNGKCGEVRQQRPVASEPRGSVAHARLCD